MAWFNTFLLLLFVVILSLAAADLRKSRSPQYSQASASAASGFGRSNFGAPKPQFGGRSPVIRPHSSGHPVHSRDPVGRLKPGATINIAKSISISTGGRSGGAKSSAGGFGK